MKSPKGPSGPAIPASTGTSIQKRILMTTARTLHRFFPDVKYIIPDVDHIENLPAGMIINDKRKRTDRKSTRLNSSHVSISYAVFCLKKKKKTRDNNV